MRENRGVTMLALVITIILLLIVAGISLDAGNDVIQRSNLENLKTNMLLLKGKVKEYVENANFELGTDESKYQERIATAKSKLKGTEITNSSIFDGNIGITQSTLNTDNTNYIYYYKISTQDFIDIGITNIKSDDKNSWYIVRYDVKNAGIEVYNTDGFEYEDSKKYSLTDIQNIEL